MALHIPFHHFLSMLLAVTILSCGTRGVLGKKYVYNITRKVQTSSLDSICMAGPADEPYVDIYNAQKLLVGNKYRLTADKDDAEVNCIRGLNTVLVTRNSNGNPSVTGLTTLPSIVLQTAFSVSIMRATVNDTVDVFGQNDCEDRPLKIRGLGKESLVLGSQRSGSTVPSSGTTEVPASNVTFPLILKDVGYYLDNFYTANPLSTWTKAAVVLSWNETCTSWIVSYVVHTQTTSGIVAIMTQATFYVPDTTGPTLRKLLSISGRNLLYYTGGTDTTTLACTMKKALIFPRPTYCVSTYSTYPSCLYKWVCA